MSRTTDTERGARMAVEIAYPHVQQRDLFPSTMPTDFWRGILAAASDQLTESKILRDAVVDRVR